MSEFHINVVRLGKMREHPNADTLNIVNIFDYPVITKKGGFKEGELVVYIPVDSVVPDTEDWHFLCPLEDGKPKYPVGEVPEKYRVIEAKKLRGIFSQGMLAPLPDSNLSEGDDVRELMGITKYEPKEPVMMGGECEPAPKGWQFSTYTDIEGMRRYPNIIEEGEHVVLTEKLHGANARYVHDGERLWVGSHTQIKKFDERNMWWKQAIKDNLEEKLSHMPMHIFFGEVYGQVQDLKYGINSGTEFRVFDVFDVKKKVYLDFHEAKRAAEACSLRWVPILFEGPWDPALGTYAEGKSTLADNVREGFVIRPIRERWNEKIGRVVLKRHGEGYLLRKKKK